MQIVDTFFQWERVSWNYLNFEFNDDNNSLLLVIIEKMRFGNKRWALLLYKVLLRCLWTEYIDWPFSQLVPGCLYWLCAIPCNIHSHLNQDFINFLSRKDDWTAELAIISINARFTEKN